MSRENGRVPDNAKSDIARDVRVEARGLSLDRIVTETLALIDEQGIAAASMRSVGDRLGVRAMSLYRYVDGAITSSGWPTASGAMRWRTHMPFRSCPPGRLMPLG